ncbi:MAG: response regulator transcription factor [Rhodobacteraceae bacterium]|nr:response regulator transcription factor [Paracoccaceae bacterium]
MHLLIADDHDLLRDTLSLYLWQQADAEVTDVASYAEAEALMDGGVQFDLVLLDYCMPGMNGLEGLARIRSRFPEQRVAVMSGTAPRDVAAQAMEMGAAGFLPKTLAAGSLVNAVRFMAMGERYLPADFLADPPPAEVNPLAALLTPRERQTLNFLCRGHSNKQIARELGLQEPTIKLHVMAVCRKLGAANRTQAALIARDSGLC